MKRALDAPQTTPGRILSIGLLAWLAMLGVDFFLHGGLLARLYLRDSPFLLPPEEAFRRIPLGYLAFLLLAGLLIWLMRRMDIRTVRAGFAFSLLLGLLAWGALALGLASIATADLDLLAGWWLGQSLELGIAGAVAGYGFDQQKIRGLAVVVIGVVFFLVIVTVLMQSFGLAPAVRV